MRSEVFNNYINIMTEKGFVDKTAEAMTRVEKENDSEYRDTIKALYGLDIPLNDSNKSIVEQAHPEKVIIAPSYDRVNGLVENIQERHDIMTGIATKPVNGNLTQHRYAQKELLDELIRLGFKLDNSGEDTLSKLADECSVKLTQEMYDNDIIKKNAIAWGVVIPWIPKVVTWVAALGGIAAIKNNLIGVLSQGVVPDTERAIEDLGKLSAVVDPKDKATVNRLIKILGLFKTKTAQVMPILQQSNNQQIESLDSPEEISSVQYKVQGSKEEIQMVRKYLDICSALASHLNSIEGEIRSMKAQRSSTENEWWHAMKWMWEGVAGDVAADAANATDALESSLVAFANKYSSSMAEETAKAKEKASGIMDELQGYLGMGEDKKSDSGDKKPGFSIPGVLRGLFE